MLEPKDLIEHAQALLKSERGKPKQVALRRAISAAYYSLFHAFLGAAADDLVGASARSRKTAAYRIVYRGFEHSDMRSTCIDAAKPALPRKMSDAIGVGRFPEPVQVAARAFVFLQERRHLADYDPNFTFSKSDALVAVETAKFAIGIFGTAGQPDRRNFLLSMLLPLR